MHVNHYNGVGNRGVPPDYCSLPALCQFVLRIFKASMQVSYCRKPTTTLREPKFVDMHLDSSSCSTFYTISHTLKPMKQILQTSRYTVSHSNSNRAVVPEL